MTAPTGFGAQGLLPRKCLWRKGKNGLSTPRALLYYYDYVFIKTLKKKTEEQPGTRSAGPCSTPGRRWRWKGQETPTLAARCGGSSGVQGPSKAVRQPTTRWMTSTAGGVALQLRSARKAPSRGWKGGASGARCPQKTKAVGTAGKTGTGCRQHAQPCRACVRKASRSATGNGLLNR